jgi:hypothetical protein
MRTDVTGAKRLSAFNKPRKFIWKHYWKLAVPSPLRSATNSFSPPKSWAGTRPTTAANWSGGSGKSAANCSARRAATVHYSNPFRPDRLITFAWHPGDVPRGIIADIVEDLGITRDEFYFGKF